MNRRLALSCFLAGCVAAAPALAQTSTNSPSGSWYAGASAVSWTNQRGPQEQPCEDHLGEALCTSAIATGPGVLVTVGHPISRRVSLEGEAGFGTGRTGTATDFSYAGHGGFDRTDATYVHHEALFSILLRLHLTLGQGRVSVEPVAGGTVAYAGDGRTNQIMTVFPWYPATPATLHLPDSGTGNVAGGVSAGADVVVPVSARISVVATTRMRWVAWCNTPGCRLAEQVGVGDRSVQLGGGLRWGGRRR